MSSIQHRLPFTASLAVALCCLLGWLALANEHRLDRGERIARIRQETSREARRGARTIDARLAVIRDVADGIAVAMESSGLRDEELRAHVAKQLSFHPDVAEIGVAYRPFRHSAEERLHGIAGSIDERTVRWVELDALQDYVGADVDWYDRPLEEGPVWLEPAYDEPSDSVRAAYARPFHETVGGEREVAGVVYVAFTAATMERLLSEFDLGEKGYSFIVTASGRYVAHPNEDLAPSPPSFEELASVAGDDPEAVGADFATAMDALTGQMSWFYYEPIPVAGWTLGAVAIQDDAVVDPDMEIETAVRMERRRLMLLSLLAGGVLLSLTLAAWTIEIGGRRRVWFLAAGFSAVCVLVTVACVLVARTMPVSRTQNRVAHRAELKRFRQQQNRRVLEHQGELPVFVPTGIYVQSAHFLSANEVQMTGYVWQTYQPGIHDGISRGFAMPEASSGEFDRLPVSADEHGERHVWRFSVVLNQEFDYSQYPLGNDDLWVQLWHEDFANNVILVPDLASYKLTSPRARPGLKDGLELPGWDIEGSYFSYREHTYQTDFGAADYSGLTHFPELYFNVSIQKQLTGPLISDFLPLAVVAVLMFTILMFSSRRDPEMTVTGFSGMNVIAACGGFFLVVVFSHIGLRRSLAVKGFIYIEHFYFLSYVLILLVSVNSLMYSRLAHRWVVHRDNLIAQQLFWPISTATIFGFTWWTLW
jgi:hypothetical protein